jgi:hypothetical protein
MVLTVLAVLAWVAPAMAWQWYALSVPEMAAHGGATHMAEFSWSDFTKTNVNTAQTFTNTIPARKSLECIAMLLDTAFTIGTTNYTDSCLMKIGDGSDDDLFLTSTELASDGTEVFVKFGPPNTYTATSTPSTTTTNLVTLRPGATNVNQTVTNAVVKTVTVSTTTTAGELGRKVYAAQGSLVFTFNPDSNQALDSFAAGKVRVFFRMFEFNR